MICIYDKNTSKGHFDNNGLCILDECITAFADYNLNGEYSLEIEYPASSHKAKHIEELNIIKADGQLFRIYKVERVQSDILKLKVWARHIFYDLAYYFIESAKLLNANALEALTMTMPPELQAIYSFTAPEGTVGPFTVKEVNAVDALFRLIEVYGGELHRDNFNIGITDNLGNDNDITVRYGKNVKGMTVIEDTSCLCTRIYAVGDNGLLLPERYIEVQEPDFAQISFPITKKVEFKDCKDVESLRAKAVAYAESAAVPKIHVSIDFLELSKIEEYRDYEKLTRVSLGDIVKVTHERLGITAVLRVMRKRVDLINTINTKIELGDPLTTIIEKIDTSRLLDEITKTITDSLSSVIIKKNSDTVTINTSKYPAMVVGFTAKADTNLNCNITMTGMASESCTLSILFSIDGVYYDFKPMQKLAVGDNVIGFSLPMPQVTAGSHTFIVEMCVSNGSFAINKNNLQLTIEGRELEGGLSASLPRAEVIYTFLYSLFLSKFDFSPITENCGFESPPDRKLPLIQQYDYDMFEDDCKKYYSDSGIREIALTVMGIIEQFSRDKSVNYQFDYDWVNWDSDFDKTADGTYESYSRVTISEPVLATYGACAGCIGPGVIYTAQLPDRDSYTNIVGFTTKLIESKEE